MSCDIVQPLGNSKKQKEGLLLHLLGGKGKRSRVHFILENQFEGKSCTNTSYSSCIPISDFTCPSQSTEKRKCVTSRRDRDGVNEGVIAVEQSQCVRLCVREQYQLSNYLEPR